MKNNSARDLITNGSQWLLKALLFLSPLLVVPYTRNLIVDTKLAMLFLATLLVLLGFAVKSLLEKKWELAISPLTLPLFLFGLMVTFSTFFTNQYPAEALLGLGGAYLVMSILGIFGSSLVKGDHTKTIINTLGLSGALLSITMILQQMGWGPTRLINAISAFNLPHSIVFNLSGSSFVAVQVLALALLGIGARALITKKLSTYDMILGLVNLIGFGLGLWSILPGGPAAVTLTPLSASWTVMLRSMESLQAAIIGHGPTAYSTAYARFKPLWTNGQDFWQFNFGSGTDTALTLAVTVGLFGLIAWLFLLVQAFKQLKNSSKESKPMLWMLLGTFLIQLLFPTNLVVLTIQIALLVFWVAANQSHFSLLQFKTVKFQSYPAKFQVVKRLVGGAKNSWFVRISSGLIVLAVVGLGYLFTRAYAGYHYMYRSNEALLANDAIQVYENQRKAVQNNPYLDSFRRDYALTNLQIAIALSNNADITEEEQQQVIQLISQAVRDGRAATVLDDDDVDNWLVLGEIYRNLIGAADEAGNWAVSSLVNAVQVNPINPIIRLDIGQLALNNGDAQDAARFFAQAIELKPDLPTGYYQLGLAYQQLGQLNNTKVAWEQALLLLPEDSQDYALLSQQLASLADQDAAVIEENAEDVTPNVTEQNVQQTESDLLNLGEDAQLEATQ